MDKSKKRKSLCILTDYMTVGGLERVVCAAISCLWTDYDIKVYALYGGVTEEVANNIGKKVTIISRYRNSFERLLLMVPFIGSAYLKLLIKEHFDYMIVLRPWFITAGYSGIADKTFFWNHSDKDIMYARTEELSFLRKLNKVRLRYGYSGFDGVWVVNDVIKLDLEKAFQLPNVNVLPNAIDSVEIIAGAQETVETSTFLEGCMNIVVVSWLSAEKGHIRLLEALTELKDECKCRIILVGDGPDREMLEKYVMHHSMEDVVYFAGMQPNPYPYMAKADLLVLPSITESFGMVLLEAMALKTPVMTTDTVGGRYLTEDGSYGLLVKNSMIGIRDGIKLLYSDPNLKEHYAQKGCIKAQEYDVKSFEKKIKFYLK